MSLSVFIAVLFAAILHASWNAIIKFGDDKLQGMVLLSLAHGIIGFILLILFPLPNAEAWPWLIASVGFHLWYKLFLTSAYEQGDLSRVYPIARGTAPLLVLIFSSIFIIDAISNQDIFSIIAIGIGIFILGNLDHLQWFINMIQLLILGIQASVLVNIPTLAPLLLVLMGSYIQ